MTKKQELVEATNTALVVDVPQWESNDNFNQKDMIIPKILLMQGLSQFVTDGKAVFCDLIDSLTGSKLGSIDKPLAIIPFYLSKTWVIMEKKGDKFEYARTEIVTPSNENLTWQGLENGIEIQRHYSRNFYVLLPDFGMLPYLVSMRGTSARTGKILASQMYVQNKLGGLPPAGMTIDLSVKRDKNAKGTYGVFQIAPKRRTTAEELATAYQWFKTVSSTEVKVDDSDLTGAKVDADKTYAADSVAF